MGGADLIGVDDLAVGGVEDVAVGLAADGAFVERHDVLRQRPRLCR